MPSKTKEELFEKLTNDVRPQNYQLTVCPNLKTFLFEGTVVIDLKVIINIFVVGNSRKLNSKIKMIKLIRLAKHVNLLSSIVLA